MKDLTNRFFLCYAWENIAEVQNVVADIEHELGAKIIHQINAKRGEETLDVAYSEIEKAEFFVLFISEASKKTDFVKRCVIRAQNLNKNILPVEIGKSSLFSSMPSEFKFRSKPYSYSNESSKAKLLAQLKACLGMNVENGDSYGCLVHIVTDVRARIMRYSQDLGVAEPGADYKIRLTKGSHLLSFISLDDESLKSEINYNVDTNDGEQFLELPLGSMLQQKKENEAKVAREAEIRKKFEEDQYENNLKFQQELERKKKVQELENQRHQMEMERKKKEQELEKQRQLMELELKRQKQLLEEEERRRNTPPPVPTKSSNGCAEGCGNTIGIIILIALGIVVLASIG